MIWGHPACNCSYSHSAPPRELCPVAEEKKRAANRRWYDKLSREGGIRYVKRLTKQDEARRERNIKRIDRMTGWN